MHRRAFVLGVSGLVICGPLGVVRAQELRAGWSANGPLEGREPADPTALTDLERSHLPVLTMPSRAYVGRPFDLVAQVGVRPHEMTPEHHVEWIEIALGDRRVAVIDLSTDVAYPIVRVPIVPRGDEPITVRARCNLHGVWRTQRPLRIG